MLKRTTPSDDAGTGPVVEVEDIPRNIREGLEARGRWDEQAAAAIASLPACPLRARLEDQRRGGNETLATIVPTIQRQNRLDLAENAREAAYELLQQARGVRKELVEEPVRDQIRADYGCPARYVESTHCTLRDGDGSAVWAGVVHTFDLIGHRTASQACAVATELSSGAARFAVTLATASIDAPEKAARAFLGSRS